MGNINRRTIVAPLAAFTMAWVLFAYTRTSIQAAKVNAQIEREKLYSQHHHQHYQQQQQQEQRDIPSTRTTTATGERKE